MITGGNDAAGPPNRPSAWPTSWDWQAGTLYDPDYVVAVPEEYRTLWIDAYEQGRASYRRLGQAMERLGVRVDELELHHPVSAHDVT